MKHSPHFDPAVIELGKKILAQFEKNHDHGILMSWMSHYVAELITRAENAKGLPDERVIREECVIAILKLWSYRNGLPTGSRPFESAEAVAKALARLAPSSTGHFYFTQPKSAGEDDSGASSDLDWLTIAEAFDNVAKVFIRLCLSQSLATSSSDLRNWLQSADGLEDDPAVDIQIVRGLLERNSDGELDETANPESTKSMKVAAKLDEIIEILTEVRATISDRS